MLRLGAPRTGQFDTAALRDSGEGKSWQAGAQVSKAVGMGNLFAVADEEKAFALAVLFAVFVPKNCDRVAVLIDSVVAKPTPQVVGQERLDVEFSVRTWYKADEDG